ncbi:MAG: DUF4926 domain-containing protein, partial [Defluviitaleaceae bacterium]|nr:DUF4926 domain-containing protein [Defluviitaleaceae bacterium]
MKFECHQAVKTLINFPEHNVSSGEIGAVVVCFTTPNEAYEVEFVNNDGSTRAMFAILPEYIESVRCLVPCYNGANELPKENKKLWDKYYTDAPKRQRQPAEQYK